MAKLSREVILKLARLSRLKLTEGELDKFTEEISAILGYVEQLKNVEMKDYEPTSQVTGLTNVMRPDVIKDYGISSSELLKNAPATDSGHIKVKRVI